MNDPLRNPKDPLRNTPDAEQQLFRQLGAVCNGFSSAQVAGAALNLLVNVIRQGHATSDKAEAQFNELTTKAREILLSKHYDAMGKRRNVFPFHQTVEMDIARFRKQ